MNIRNFLYLTLITYNLTLISSCTEDNIPREKAYPRFYFPKKDIYFICTKFKEIAKPKFFY